IALFFVTMIAIIFRFTAISARIMQKQLFKALVIQTAIPCLFSYLPLALIFIFPIFGIHLGGFIGDLLIMSTALFPAFDPILITICVPSFREKTLLSFAKLVGQSARFNEWKAGRSKQRIMNLTTAINA
ncbi:hypothetical protein PFISCL1PPCAC_15318, partial [Pristionchus fissidentatus]